MKQIFYPMVHESKLSLVLYLLILHYELIVTYFENARQRKYILKYLIF